MNVSGMQGLPGFLPPQAPAAKPAPVLPRNTVLVLPTPGLPLRWGQILRGQVLDQVGNRYTVQFGAARLEAQSRVPLRAGEHIEVQVQGQGADGRVSLQLLRTSVFGPMTREDLAQTLTGLRQPVNEETMALARSMVEMGLPLTAQTLREISQALARLPAQAQMDSAAAGFLKLNGLPLNAENINTMSVFMAQHPMLGAQLFEISIFVRRLAEQPGTARGSRTAEMLAKIPGLLGEFIMNPAQQTRQRLHQSLFHLARQMGIEPLPLFGPDSNPEEWMEMLRQQRNAMSLEGQTLARVAELFEQLEGNIKAHVLINQGRRTDELLGWYCLQVPMRLEEEVATGRLRITYRHDEQGRTWVDENDLAIEFSIETENLGALHFRLWVRGELLELEAAVGSEDVRQVLETHLPALLANFKGLGFIPGRADVGLLPGGVLPEPDLVRQAELETLERVNLRM